MKVRLAFPVDQISGKAGGNFGNVFFGWRGLQVSRKHFIPRNPSSTNQDSVRGMLAAGAVAFQSLTPSEKAAWATYAAGLPVSILGQSVKLPEISMYSRINMYRQLAGQSISDTPPTDSPGVAVTGITKFLKGAQDYTLTFKFSGTAGTNKFLIRMTSALPSQVYNPKRSDYRLIEGAGNTGSIVAADSSPQTETFDDTVYEPAALSYVSIAILPLSSTYAPGVEYAETIQVTSA